MARGDSKVNPTAIVRAHCSTYVNAQTGQPRWQDHALIEGLPAVAGLLSGLLHVHLPSAASVGLLTVAGLLSAFLFGVMLQVADRASAWEDTKPVRGLETTAHAEYLTQLAANAGYSSIVAILTAVIFVVSAACSKGWPLLAASSVGIAVGVHLILTLLMVMKRVFTLTQNKLQDVLTGV